MACCYSLDSSRWVLLNEYPCARVSVIFWLFKHHIVLTKSAFSGQRVDRIYHSRGVQLSHCPTSTNITWNNSRIAWTPKPWRYISIFLVLDVTDMSPSQNYTVYILVLKFMIGMSWVSILVSPKAYKTPIDRFKWIVACWPIGKGR